MIRLPSGVDINNLINDLRILSWEAADILLYYSNLFKDQSNNINLVKNNSENPVTLADLKVNELIIKSINQIYKDINWGILSEENTKVNSFEFEKKSSWCWILDPLDGTKDFIQGTGNYAMQLALNYKNNPYVGVVLVPEKNELWFSNGEKVWGERRDGSGIETNLSSTKIINEMRIVTSKNHRNQILKNLIERVKFKDVSFMGSVGCKIASILRGENDIYICLSLPGKSSPKDWDFAAPETILKVAGGDITTIDNKKLTYGKSNFEQGGIIIASNNKNNHKSLCQEIKNIVRKFDLYPY